MAVVLNFYIHVTQRISTRKRIQDMGTEKEKILNIIRRIKERKKFVISAK